MKKTTLTLVALALLGVMAPITSAETYTYTVGAVGSGADLEKGENPTVDGWEKTGGGNTWSLGGVTLVEGGEGYHFKSNATTYDRGIRRVNDANWSYSVGASDTKLSLTASGGRMLQETDLFLGMDNGGTGVNRAIGFRLHRGGNSVGIYTANDSADGTGGVTLDSVASTLYYGSEGNTYYTNYEMRMDLDWANTADGAFGAGKGVLYGRTVASIAGNLGPASDGWVVLHTVADMNFDGANLDFTDLDAVENWTSSAYTGFAGFEITTIVPEPATMSLLALGGIAMLRRRKK